MKASTRRGTPGPRASADRAPRRAGSRARRSPRPRRLRTSPARRSRTARPPPTRRRRPARAAARTARRALKRPERRRRGEADDGCGLRGEATRLPMRRRDRSDRRAHRDDVLGPGPPQRLDGGRDVEVDARSGRESYASTRWPLAARSPRVRQPFDRSPAVPGVGEHDAARAATHDHAHERRVVGGEEAQSRAPFRARDARLEHPERPGEPRLAGSAGSACTTAAPAPSSAGRRRSRAPPGAGDDADVGVELARESAWKRSIDSLMLASRRGSPSRPASAAPSPATERSRRSERRTHPQRGALEVEWLVVDDVAAKPRRGSRIVAHRCQGAEKPSVQRRLGVDPETLRVRADVRDRGLDVHGRVARRRRRPSERMSNATRSARTRRAAAPSRPSGRDPAGPGPAEEHGRQTAAGAPRAVDVHPQLRRRAGRRRSGCTFARCMPGICRTTALPAVGFRYASAAGTATSATTRIASAAFARPLLQLAQDLVRPPIHASAWAIPQRSVTYPKYDDSSSRISSSISRNSAGSAFAPRACARRARRAPHGSCGRRRRASAGTCCATRRAPRPAPRARPGTPPRPSS